MNNFDLEFNALETLTTALEQEGFIKIASPVIKGDNPHVNPTSVHIHMMGFEYDLSIIMRPVKK